MRNPEEPTTPGRSRARRRLPSEDILSDSLDGIACTDAKLRVTVWNPAMERITGVAAAEAAGKPAGEVLPFAGEAGGRAALERTLRGDKIVVAARLPGTGCGTHFEAHLSPVRGASGKVTGTLVILREAGAGRSEMPAVPGPDEALFTAFMDHLPGIALLKDGTGRYTFASQGCGRMLGKSRDEILGRTDEALWPKFAGERAARDREVLETGRSTESLEQLPFANGTRQWMFYRFPVPGPGGARLLGAIGLDVTERRQLEDQLRQSQKMDAIGRLAGGVAHDFNNLLTIIGGYGRMMLDQLPDGERTRGSMELILNAADRAAVLTSQLLAFSRRQLVQPKLLELNHVISNLEKMLRRVIGEHIVLTTSLDPALPRVMADAGQIEQIVMNLAINARDAMARGGRLTIETGRAERNAGAAPGLFARLSVVDTGVGMDAQTRSHLFEPFFTTKGRGKGTGLGLSTVCGIVRHYGGEIAVDSELGAGTRFDIYLPAASADEPGEVPHMQPRQPRRGHETILLVEDEAGVRQLARDVLQAQGYRVLAAADGNEAVRLAERERVDLLLTDMIMPLMSGREVSERLLAMQPGAGVIYMSGYTDDVIAYHGELGEDAVFVQKPFMPQELTHKVRDVLDAGKRAREARQ